MSEQVIEMYRQIYNEICFARNTQDLGNYKEYPKKFSSFYQPANRFM